MTKLESSEHYGATRSAAFFDAANGLALVRVTIGAMFLWVFFENLGKGLYTPGGYAGLINYYVKSSHSPAVWKAIMGIMASHAAIAAPLQAMTEISSRGFWPRHRSAYPAGSACCLSVPRQSLDFGVGHCVDLGATGSCPRFSWARGWTRRPKEMGS